MSIRALSLRTSVGLSVFIPLGKNAQRERLDLRDRVVTVASVDDHSGDVWNLRDPAAVVLAFDLNVESLGVLGATAHPSLHGVLLGSQRGTAAL